MESEKKKELIIVKKMLKSGSGYSFYTKRLSFYPAKREKKNKDLKSVKSFENLFNQQKLTLIIGKVLYLFFNSVCSYHRFLYETKDLGSI